jgi:hypothetical protein
MKKTKHTAEEIASINVIYKEVSHRNICNFNKWMKKLKNTYYANNEEMLKAFDKFN